MIKNAISILLISFCSVLIFLGFHHFEKVSRSITDYSETSFTYEFPDRPEFRSNHKSKQIKAQIKMEPESYRLWENLSRSLLQEGQFNLNNALIDQAFAAALKAKKLNPESIHSLLLQGEILRLRGFPFKAVHHANAVLAKGMQLWGEGLLLRAKSFLDLGRLDAAFADIEVLLQRSPSFSGYSLLAQIYIAQGDVASAVEAVRQAIVYEKVGDIENSFINRKELAWAFLGLDELPVAEKMIGSLEEMLPREGETLALMAELSIRKQAFYSARAQLQAALSKRPDFRKQLRLAQVESYLGKANEYHKQLDLVEASVREAIAMGFYNEKINLVKVLAEKATPSSLTESLELIETMGHYSRDRFETEFKVKHLLNDPSALDLFHSFLGRPNPEQLKSVAQIYSADSQWLLASYYYAKSLLLNLSL